jgi:hypothetical protein
MEQATLGQQQQAQVPPGQLTGAPSAQAPHTQAPQMQAPQMQAQHAPAPLKHGQSLEPDVQAHLGRQLRAVYDEMASQPVPDRFIQLLDALERKSIRAPEPTAGTKSKVGGV